MLKRTLFAWVAVKTLTGIETSPKQIVAEESACRHGDSSGSRKSLP
jgi:hypothetical protein